MPCNLTPREVVAHVYDASQRNRCDGSLTINYSPIAKDMILRKIFVTLLILTGVALTSVFAAVKDLPVVEVNGAKYHYYVVQPQETLYSLLPRLGVTRDQLIAWNPTVADGLKAGMTLYFPVSDSGSNKGDNSATVQRATADGATEISSGDVVRHKVAKGETIYGLAHTYGVSTDELIAENPFVADGLKVGQTLTITLKHRHDDGGNLSETLVPEPAHADSKPLAYIVKSKETFYSIARAHNLTVAELEEANPGITVLKEGQVLSIPTVAETAPVSSGNPSGTPSEVSDAPSGKETAEVSGASSPSAGDVQPIDADKESISESSVVTTPAKTGKSIDVAIVLPFMLAEETPSKSAQRYTEFYKGFLMAVDSLRNNGTPIHVRAYDTEGSMARLTEIIADSSLQSCSMIIAPDNAAQLSVLSDFGKAHGIKVLNNFKVRDDGYLTNPALMQGNIPSQEMLDKAVDAMAQRVRYTTPVFVNLEGGANDKTEFTDALKKKLDELGVKWQTITAPGKLEAAGLKSLPADGSYSFIPMTGRQAELNKILPAIIQWRDEVVMPSVKVIGYPEWVTFRGETLDNMHSLNTIVYSRFFTEDSNPRVRRIEEKFKNWYGSNMDSAIPRQGLLGFDTGMFVINYLKSSRGYYDGVQNGFSFKGSENGAGSFNQLLYLVNYRPGGVTEKTAL